MNIYIYIYINIHNSTKDSDSDHHDDYGGDTHSGNSNALQTEKT